MSRRPTERLEDIRVACLAIERHLQRGDASDELIFDAVRVRLIEIGEAVKDLDAATTAVESDVPWADISRMRDVLAHRYFDTTHSIVAATAQEDVPRLLAAVQRMLGRDTGDTGYLLGSPENARRLGVALHSARAGDVTEPDPLDPLSVGLS